MPANRKLLIDLDNRTTRGGRLRLQTRGDGARHRVDAFRTGRIWSEQRHRLAGIAADANLRIDFDLAEQRHAVGFRDAPPFAVAEDVDASLAMRATQETHVFTAPENIPISLANPFPILSHT